MRHLELLMLLLPIVFMLHEYEEIILLKSWSRKHRFTLRRRFPRLEFFLSRQGLFACSTAAFAAATAYEFLVLSSVTFYAVWQGIYAWWFAAFAGHTLHLFLHLLQGLAYRQYAPFLLTSLLSLPYCIYTFKVFCTAQLLSFSAMLLWGALGGVLAFLVLFSALFLMRSLQRAL
ncbi:MAG: HXXEE domain-containing protein [Bacteroidales bacterium]|nr:HXXEE domain-containing protein [Bacteroidales bacterium]